MHVIRSAHFSWKKCTVRLDTKSRYETSLAHRHSTLHFHKYTRLTLVTSTNVKVVRLPNLDNLIKIFTPNVHYVGGCGLNYFRTVS